MSLSEETLRKGEKAAKIGFISIALLGAAKGFVGFTSNSVSLLAQAIDSLTDAFALVAVFLGLRLSQREPSNRFPYGYYRTETFASLIVSVFILLTGAAVLSESVLQLLYPNSILEPLKVVTVASISIPILYLLHRYVRSVGVEIHSQSLQSQAEDFKVDIYASLLVLLAVTASHWGFSWLEGVIGVMISLLILKTGLSLSWETLLVLMDAVVKPERLEMVKKIVLEVRGVRSVHKARIRQAGPFYFVDLSIGVDKRVPVEQAHQLTEGIEKRIKNEFPFVESISVQIKPQEETVIRVAVPILEDKGMDSQTTPHLGEAPYFLFVDIEEGEIQKWMTQPNPGLGLEKKRGITAAHLLVKQEITTLLARQLGEGPFHYLRDSFIEIYGIPKSVSVSEALETFLAGMLLKMEKPTT